MQENYVDMWQQPFNLWAFIILIILIGSIFSYLKQRSRNEVIKEALRSGQAIDPELLKDIQEKDDNSGGLVLAGCITIAVAVGLVFLGYQIGKVDGDEEVFEIMKGVAAIPGLIGLVLLLGGVLSKLTKSNKE